MNSKSDKQKSNLELSKVPLNVENNRETPEPTHKSIISGSYLPSTYTGHPSSKLNNFQHRLLLKNIANLWPPDSIACNVSQSDMHHIANKIRWFKRWIKGICYTSTRHSHVNVQKSLDWLWTNKKYVHNRKLQKVRQRTGLSTKCMEAWLKWKQSERRLDLKRKMLWRMFHEDQYPNTHTVKALSVHTNLSAYNISLWFLVSRVLVDAIDNNRTEKDEMILWRMFEHCKNVGHVKDKDVELISDLLDIDSTAVYKIFQHWCYKHDVPNRMTAQKYPVIEEWFQMFESQASNSTGRVFIAPQQTEEPDQGQQISPTPGLLPQSPFSTSTIVFSSTTDNRTNDTIPPPPPTEDCHYLNQQTNKQSGKISEPCTSKLPSSDAEERLRDPCEITSGSNKASLSQDDPAMVMFSEHFHRYIHKHLKKMRRSQSKSGIPKKASVINRRKRPEPKEKGCCQKKEASQYPSFHKQDEPDVQFVACLRPGSKSCAEESEGEVASTQCQAEGLIQRRGFSTGLTAPEFDNSTETVDALYDVLNRSDEEVSSSDETEIITIDSDSDNELTRLQTTPCTSTCEDGLPSHSHSSQSSSDRNKFDQESNPCNDLFHLFQTRKQKDL